jgi:Tetratricopeptide repeat
MLASQINITPVQCQRFTPVGAAEPMARLVAVLDPAGAPEAVFTGQTGQGYLSAISNLMMSQSGFARGALRALHRLSILIHDPDLIEPRAVRMHNLTGRAVLQALDRDDIAALVQIAADALLEGWPEIDRDPALVETLRANTATLTALQADALWNEETGAHPILFRSGRSLEKVGLVTQAIAYYTALNEQATQRMGPDHIATIASSSNLASAYVSAGDFGQAIPVHEQTPGMWVGPSRSTSRPSPTGSGCSAPTTPTPSPPATTWPWRT